MEVAEVGGTANAAHLIHDGSRCSQDLTMTNESSEWSNLSLFSGTAEQQGIGILKSEGKEHNLNKSSSFFNSVWLHYLGRSTLDQL